MSKDLAEEFLKRMTEGLKLRDDTAATLTYVEGDQIIIREITAEEFYAKARSEDEGNKTPRPSEAPSEQTPI